MSKEEALKLLMLLSSIESWVMSTKVGIPDHNRQQLMDSTALLTKIVLGEDA